MPPPTPFRALKCASAIAQSISRVAVPPSGRKPQPSCRLSAVCQCMFLTCDTGCPPSGTRCAASTSARGCANSSPHPRKTFRKSLPNGKTKPYLSAIFHAPTGTVASAASTASLRTYTAMKGVFSLFLNVKLGKGRGLEGWK